MHQATYGQFIMANEVEISTTENRYQRETETNPYSSENL